MADSILETKQFAEANGLEFKDNGNGHVQIIGHGIIVNYYPESKKRTIYCPDTGLRERGCTPWDAVKACLNAAKPSMKPKAKVTNNPPQVDIKPIHQNPAGIKHLYTGERPPWEGETFISCYTDDLREEARQLNERADIEDNLNWEYQP